MTDIDRTLNLISIPDHIEVELRRELIDELGAFAAYNRTILSDVHATFEHMEEGLNLVYGLDFDIIYAYANPWSRDANHAEMARYIIEEDRTPLALLPGTVEELFAFVKHAQNQQLEAKALRKSLKSGRASDETIECALNLCKSDYLGKHASSQKVDLSKLSWSLLEVSERYGSALKRIELLLDSERVVDLASLYRYPDEPVFNEALAHHFFVRLAAVRKGPEYKYANETDAKNIATIVQYAQLENKAWEKDPDNYKGRILRLLTNTRCILDMQIEGYKDEIIHSVAKPLKGTIDAISHSLAVRSCFEACYAAVIAVSCGYDNTLCRQKSGEQFERSQVLEIATERLDEYERDRRQSRRADTQRIKKVLDDYIPNYAKEFVTDEWYQTIKRLLVVDAREQKSKKCLERTDASWWIPLTEGISDLTRQHLLDIQRSDLTKITLHFKKREPEDILAKVGIKDRDLQLVGKGAPKRWIVENIFRPGREEIFTFDQLSGGLYASWPCGLVESQVIDVVNRLFLVEDGLLAKNSHHGEILVVYEDGEYISRLCKLPLAERLTLERYRNLLSNLKDLESGLPGEAQVPSEVRCDTPICAIKFDVLVPGADEGVMFAFKNPALVDVLLDIFHETSSWAKGWLFASEVNKLIEEGVRRRIEE